MSDHLKRQIEDLINSVVPRPLPFPGSNEHKLLLAIATLAGLKYGDERLDPIAEALSETDDEVISALAKRVTFKDAPLVHAWPLDTNTTN